MFGFGKKKDPQEIQRSLDIRLCELAGTGNTHVKRLLAAGANVHANNDDALCQAVEYGNYNGPYGFCGDIYHPASMMTVKVLLEAGANVHARSDYALCSAVRGGHTELVQVLAKHIFTPDSWRGKSRAAIEAAANALYDKIKAQNPQPDRLRTAGVILIDCAMQCWEQVRPPPPKLQISPLPAQARPL
jgi:hypothetical protein